MVELRLTTKADYKALVDESGRILELNHHLLPVLGQEPELFDSIVFESWYGYVYCIIR